LIWVDVVELRGRTVGVYHHIESKGIDLLRNIYASAALSMKPRSGTMTFTDSA